MRSRILYLDCFGGISGDMTLGALIDAGASIEAINNQLQLLNLKGYSLQVYRDKSYGFQGTRVLVQFNKTQEPVYRTYRDILKIIDNSKLASRVKKTALNIFQKLAQAEGKVHGIAPEEVHFHEVGAIDSIVDIVGAAIALEELSIEKVYCSSLPGGYGYVQNHHGILPVPAPATAELLKGVPLRSLKIEGELVTPTGAAIASSLATSFGPLPDMIITSIGYGLGTNDYGIPNFLRAFIGYNEGLQEKTWQEVSILQTNIDDLNPEILAFTAEKLMKSGALDVFITPIVMKKGRLGSLLTVLCLPETENSLLKIIFQESTTLGVRLRREKRCVLPREEVAVETKYGKVRVKIAGLQVSPEYEDCQKLAQEKNVPLKKIYEMVREAAAEKLK